MRLLEVRSASALLAAALLSVSSVAGAAGEAVSGSASLEMRLLALEDELAATKAALAAHTPVAAQVRAGGNEDKFDAFFRGLEVGGHIAASYIYNFNKSDASGSNQILCQFNCAQNQFKLDAAKLEIGRPSEGPGTAGFQLDLLFGQNADISRFLSPTAGGAGVFGEDDFSLFLQQAYVEYNWNGTLIKFGNWETLLGYELIDTNDNPNVSHGILFTWTIPLYHTGILFSGDLAEGVGWALGLSNGFNNTIDTNDNKGVLGQLSWESGPLFASISGYYGADSAEGTMGQPSSSDQQLILDVVATYAISDTASLWLNVDWGEQEDGDPTGGDADWWGVAAGARFALSDRAYLALRGEYFEDEDVIRGISFPGAPPPPPELGDLELWSVTGTFGYNVTENLLLRTELRYNQADEDATGGDIFPDDSTRGFDDSEWLGILEVTYAFD